MLVLIWIRGLLARRRGHLAACAAGVAVAVALVASLGAFLASSKAVMTHRAGAGVAVDWQVAASPGADLAGVVAEVQGFPGVQATAVVGFAQVAGLTAVTGPTTQTTGAATVVGLPPGYAETFPGALRPLTGAAEGVLLTPQTAANLHAAVGAPVHIAVGAEMVTVQVEGVVDLPQADAFFRPPAPAGPTNQAAQPAAPPDNVVLLPLARWRGLSDALAVSRPDLVHTEVHARLEHSLPPDPAAAATAVARRARNLEARLAGRGVVGDNLGSALAAARSDALYAQVLFLFLGAPGAILAALLAGAVAGARRGRRRDEQALLRARGATARTLARLAAAEAGVIGLGGSAAGLAAAALVGRLAFGTARFGASPRDAAVFGAAASALGVAVALAAVAVPAWRDARRLSVASARLAIDRPGLPRWRRWGVDVTLLAVAVLVFWLSARARYHLVLAPEATPSISVSYWVLAAPVALWAGAALLFRRSMEAGLAKGRRPMARALAPVAGRLAPAVAAALSRQRRLLARGGALVALTAAFAVSTAVFNATYRQQAEADARLTNGADVSVAAPPGAGLSPEVGRRLAGVPGVVGVEALQHRFAYVGADLQDLFGVDPATIARGGRLKDAYFAGGGASALMRRLAVRPDAVLVSAETVADFQLGLGDTLKLRLSDGRGGALVEVPFTYVGVVKEFPTAPRDSFLVAKASYVAERTHSDAVGSFLVDTHGPPGAVAQRVREILGPTVEVTDVAHARALVGSTLTAVDLRGLTRVELGFAFVLVAGATGLMLALGVEERRRTFAIAAALGAGRRELGAFVWAEAGVVNASGAAAGAVIGAALSIVLVKILTEVFDPPPSSLSIPWLYLAALLGAALAAVVAGGLVALARIRRDPASALRGL